MPQPKPNPQSGQLLVEVLIATSIFTILSAAIISLVVLLYQTIADVRIKTIARHLAVQQMELLHNVPYDDLGTTHGIPPGSLAEFSSVNRNGFVFTIHTSITYVDDPFDQQSPQDLLPTDYKQSRIEVSWDKELGIYSKPIVLVSLHSPKGIETTAQGGTLSVFAINSSGQPISAASVNISNTAVTPNVNVTLQTDNNGLLILPGAPPCAQCYNITVTKSLFSTDKTYKESEVANPNKRPLTVVAGSLTESTFIIDRLAQISFSSYTGIDNFNPAPNTVFRLTGQKTIGLDSLDNPVYKFDQTLSTGSSGIITLNNVEWDTYLMSLPSSTGKQLTGSYPHQPMQILPGAQIQLAFATTPISSHSLLLRVHDATGSAIASASAMLRLNDFVATRSSGLKTYPNFGQAFFNDISAGTYGFTLTHPDYKNLTGQILVNGISTDTVIMDLK